MVTIVLQVLGGTAFFAATVALSVWLRQHPGKEEAERASRVSHALFWLGLVLPQSVGIFYPALGHYDELLGLPSFPGRPVALVAGALAILAGLYLSFVSQAALRRLGEGTNAFRLTQRLVAGDIYSRTRNPMSLGYYLLCLGIGLALGSTYITLGTLLALVPIHALNLKIFEEVEYYRRRVPFLLPRLGSSEGEP
jgi:protein-S-isoprenylcysteine O-methyltransferase Ste14